MEESFVYPDICVNCDYEFQSEIQARTKTKQLSFAYEEHHTSLNSVFSKGQLQISDAIYYIFGLTFQDLYPERDISNEIRNGNGSIVLCSDCTPLLKKLYDSFKDFKNVSRGKSLLWNSVKQKSYNTVVKSEFLLDGLDNCQIFQNSDNAVIDIKGEVVIDNYNDDENEHQSIYNEFTAVQTPEMLIDNDYLDENDILDDDTLPHKIFGNHDHYQMVDKNGISKTIIPSNMRNRRITPRFSKQQKKVVNRYLNVKSKKRITKKVNSRRWKLKTSKKCVETEETVENIVQWQVEHLDSLCGVAPIVCCNNRFEDDVNFRAHMKQNHGNEPEKSEQDCGICKRKILSKYMNFHVNVLHQDLSAFECFICEKAFSTKKYLRRHKKKMHRNPRPPEKNKKTMKVFCEECQKYLAYDYFHRTHKKIAHNKEDVQYMCEICGKSFKAEHNLQIHCRHVHSSSADKCCDVCGKIFKNAKNLCLHRKIHEADLVTDKEKFKCPQCGITLKHTQSLRKHLRVTHGKRALKTFSCELCGKTTKTMTNMRIHMKVHDPNRNTKHSKQKTATAENIVTPTPIIPTNDH